MPTAALPATIVIAIIAAVRLHRHAVIAARADGYLTALHDTRRGLLDPPKPEGTQQ